MKIRTDFVTNSSSSSFVTFSIHNKELAEICKKYNIPVSAWNGKVEATWYSEDSLYNHYPSDGNVALWFAELLTGDFDRLSYSDAAISDARAELTAKATQLSSTTEFSTIEICQIDTEDVGSSYFCQEKEKGVIKTISVDEEDWEGDDEDRALWQVLSEEDFGSVVEYAEEHGFVSKQADKYSFNPDTSGGYKASYEVELVGTGKEGRAPNHEYMSVGDAVELVREPNNPYDANAILVTGKGRGLGHVPAYVAEEIAWQLDSGKFIVANAKVNSATPLSQRGNRAKNPLMTISFDIVASNNKTTKNSKKETATKTSTKKAESKSSNEDIYGKSAFVEFFDLIIGSYDFDDETKQKYHDELIKNIHGYMFALLMLSFSNDVEPEEIAKVLSKEKIEEVLGINRVFVIFITQMYTIITGDGYSEEIIEQVYGAISYAMFESRDVYCNFLKRIAKEFPNVKSALKYINDLLSQTESMDNVDDDGIVEDDNNNFDIIAAEQAKAEIVDSLEDIKNSLEALGQQAQAMAEEARQREQAEIDEATKRGKYIPIEFKSNNIFPEGFAELLEQGKPYPKYYEHDFEIFVRRIKEIIPVDISDVPEDVLYKHEGRYTIDHVEYFAGRTVDLWNKYLLSLKGVETDFSVWQIEKWGIGYCDDIDKLIFELDDKFWLNGFVSEDEDFEFDKGTLKKYKGKASNIVLPEGIIQFASSKFYNANKDISNVTSFTFPRTLKKFDTQSETPFPKMRNLTRVDVSDNNEIFSSVNGVLLNKDGTELLYYPIAKRDKEYTLPKTVIKVLPNVFTKNRYVEKIIVPGNVVEIGEGAFSNCINLKSVIFENGVKTIAKNAFKGCSSLEEIFIPESMEKFLMTSFQKCEELKTIYVPEDSKVMVNAEKMAAKFGAELVKYKAGETVEDVMKKAKPTNSTPKIHVAVNKDESGNPLAQKVEATAKINAKPISTSSKDVKPISDTSLKNKVDKRIKELEEQIKSNEEKYSFGPAFIIGGLLLIAIFLYRVFDEYNAYQVSAAFYNYPSSDSLTIAMILFVIASIVGIVAIVSGFVRMGKKRKLETINCQLQKEIELLKDPKNYSSYFNRHNLDNKENIEKPKGPNKFVKFIKTIFIILVVIAVVVAIFIVFGEILTIVASIGFVLCWFIFGSGKR